MINGPALEVQMKSPLNLHKPWRINGRRPLREHKNPNPVLALIGLHFPLLHPFLSSPRRFQLLRRSLELYWDKIAMADETPAVNYIEETVLKKRKNNEEWAINKRARLADRKKSKQQTLKHAIKRPEEFVKEFRDKELDLVCMKNRLKRRKPAKDTLKSKLLFVIRIHGSKDMHPKTRQILNKLRLRQILNGVFLRANEANLKMLLSVEPFVTYGYPNLKSVRELIFKKGCGKIDKDRLPLTDNNVIEQALEKYGVICLQDIVHEIATVGPHFKEVANFLWPMRLKCPERRLQMKKKLYKDGGDTGNRDDHINELIDKLN